MLYIIALILIAGFWGFKAVFFVVAGLGGFVYLFLWLDDLEQKRKKKWAEEQEEKRKKKLG